MTTQQRKEWLASLKAGDLVAVRGCGMSRECLVIRRVTKLTTGGNIKVGTELFRKGTHRLSRWELREIEPVTDELVEDLTIRRLAHRFQHEIDWAKLPLETLSAVATLVPAPAKPESEGPR